VQAAKALHAPKVRFMLCGNAAKRFIDHRYALTDEAALLRFAMKHCSAALRNMKRLRCA